MGLAVGAVAIFPCAAGLCSSLGIEKTDKFKTYYLPAPRPSSSALFQRVCLAWD